MSSPPSRSPYPRFPKLLILGEAPGEEEVAAGRPFVGASGKLLRNDLLPAADLDIDTWHMLNVIHTRAAGNNIDNLKTTKTDAKKAGLNLSPFIPLVGKKYWLPSVYPHFAQTDAAIRTLAPDFILALGATALWFLTGDASIGNHRGTILNTRHGPALATYHPAAVLRQWSFRPIVWADLRKVRRYLEGTLPAPLHRRFCINPTFAELSLCESIFLSRPHDILGVDIETAPSTRQITTISFASPTFGICIPLWNKYAAPGTDPSYWPSAAEETRAWRWIDRFAQLPHVKVLQNGLYDMQYLLDAPLPIRLRNVKHDTSIMHHALQPELPKALGTLASLYLNEPSWKFMRTSDKDAKAEE